MFDKKRRETEEISEPEETGFLLKPEPVEVGSGYTLSVKYDRDDTPIVDVKTIGEVDLTRLRREIQRAFPHAQIRRVAEDSQIIVAKKMKKTLKGMK